MRRRGEIPGDGAMARVTPAYRQSEIDGAVLVAREDVHDAMATALRSAPPDSRTLHDWARVATDRPPMMGRQAAYAAPLPGGQFRVVVRHNRHGGMLRGLTGDLFLPPTSAPAELELSNSLRKAGVPTPEVLGYAVYRAGILARADVVSAEIAPAEDLGALLSRTQPGDDARREAWTVVDALLDALRSAGARHYDLNVKNILLHRAEPSGSLRALALDVDRVALGVAPAAADEGNRGRLARSVAKWIRTRRLAISDGELDALRRRGSSRR